MTGLYIHQVDLVPQQDGREEDDDDGEGEDDAERVRDGHQPDRADEDGAEVNLDGRPPQHQIAHSQRRLVYQEGVRCVQDAKNQ